jgi:hypothetical protein
MTCKNVEWTAGSQSFAGTTFKSEKANQSDAKKWAKTFFFTFAYVRSCSKRRGHLPFLLAHPVWHEIWRCVAIVQSHCLFRVWCGESRLIVHTADHMKQGGQNYGDHTFWTHFCSCDQMWIVMAVCVYNRAVQLGGTNMLCVLDALGCAFSWTHSMTTTHLCCQLPVPRFQYSDIKVMCTPITVHIY